MNTKATFVSAAAVFLSALSPLLVMSQTSTTGRIAGRVHDVQGGAIIGAEVTVENLGTTEKRTTLSDESGSFSLPLLPPASYELKIQAAGFTPAIFGEVAVGPTVTATVNATLKVGNASFEIKVTDTPPLLRSDSAELNTTLESRRLTESPFPMGNFLQLLTLAPGVSAPLTNNNAVGRNTPNVSVNGARVTQNTYMINGVDANDISLHVFADVGVPAPESISEANIQTSMYDASVAGAGGSVQVVTKSGGKALHGTVYEYFGNEAFNANDSNLKAAGESRPVMRHNMYGAAFGGPLRKDRAFFFGSYQGTRDTNGATDESIYKSVLVAPGLTDDRSVATLMNTFGVPSVDPISLRLLNLKLPNGKFLIPTPQTIDGHVTGTALSTYHEEQLNANFDYRPSSKDSFSGKFFFAHAPLFSALGGANFGFAASSFPGFGTSVLVDNRVLSLQEVHSFSPATVNEARFGYSLIGHSELPQEAVLDSAIGIERSTAGQYPGLPVIVLGRDVGGPTIGTSIISYRGSTPLLSFADVLALQRGAHALRMGGEIRHSEWNARAAVLSYGDIEFPSFEDFLIGNTGPSQFVNGTFGFAQIGAGLQKRHFITTDTHLFVQDDWKLWSKFTVNLGLRYELDVPPYESHGRIGGFDPELYQPRMEIDGSGLPVGPPLQGIVEAGNGPPEYSLPGVLRVGKRVVKSIDPNNFGPRIGLAWSPLGSDRIVVRAGYGIFFARPSFFSLALEYFNPPFFLDAETSGEPFASPFATAPPETSFPLVQHGSQISGWSTDRNSRTPYVQEFNTSLQYRLRGNIALQVAYVGSRGVNLLRTVGVNQAAIASLSHPIFNAVTGLAITDNTFENAPLRAPMQGVVPGSFGLNESTAQSTYHALQATLKHRISHGLQFSASYTLSKSIDNATNAGVGPGARGGGFDTANLVGNQLGPHANRGVSDFDCTHLFAASYAWDLPSPASSLRSAKRLFFSDWQVSGVVIVMSGLPVDTFDPAGGFLYGQFGARPNWAPGYSKKTAQMNVPPGYYFNPAAFVAATVEPGQPIPSSHDPTALSSEGGTDFGNVGRNVLRGPSQSNIDFSAGKHFFLAESKNLEFRAEFFNLLNHANRHNPISDVNSGDFGRIVSFSSSPRIIQLSIKFNF